VQFVATSMGDVSSTLSEELREFLLSQPVFFVATAPLSAGGLLNVSPKGLDTLRVLSPQECAYLDLTGSGNETSAHVLENGRMTLMACSFGERPNILRIYGRGTVHLPGSRRWSDLITSFPEMNGVRQIFTLQIERVQTSCGFGVPKMKLIAPRDALNKWATAKGSDGLERYRAEKNRVSVDGMPTHLGRVNAEGPAKEPLV
jgi:hypothetical protein